VIASSTPGNLAVVRTATHVLAFGGGEPDGRHGSARDSLAASAPTGPCVRENCPLLLRRSAARASPSFYIPGVLLPRMVALGLVTAISLAQVSPALEPDPSKVALPVLDAARERPEALWAFLIDPETPYEQAMAAAHRCRDVFSLRLLGPLWRAHDELQREHEMHWFGFVMPDRATPWNPPKDVARERHLLGRVFVLPEQHAPYPKTWADAVKAPWPWRVMHVLERVLITIAPRGHELEQPRNQAWLAECLTWSIDDDLSARIFVEATASVQHTKTLAVLAHWRRIVLDPNTPQAANRVASQLGAAHQLMLWGDADARLACHLIAADALSKSSNLLVRLQCGYALRALVQRCTLAKDGMKEDRGPLPVEAVIAVGDIALATPPLVSPAADAWNALCCYAFPVCDAVERPPFVANRNMKCDSPEVAQLRAQFAAWWGIERPKLELQAGERAAAMAALRERLEALAR
jgi:hypothetical protein